MPTDFPNLLIPVAATLVGAVVAGYASFLAGRGMRSHDWRLSLVREKLLDYRQLYARFLAQADGLILLSAPGAKRSIEELAPLIATFSELSLVATHAVSKSAARMCELVLSTISQAEDGDSGYFGAKADFLSCAREEIAAMEASVQKRPFWKKS